MKVARYIRIPLIATCFITSSVAERVVVLSNNPKHQTGEQGLAGRQKENARRTLKEEVVKWPLDKIKKNLNDYYFRAWLMSRNEAEAGLASRRSKLKIAVEMFKNIKRAAPNWRPKVVEARIKATQIEVDKLKK